MKRAALVFLSVECYPGSLSEVPANMIVLHSESKEFVPPTRRPTHVKVANSPSRSSITEVVGVKKFSGVPRGCALSYLTHYVGRFDPDRALTIWEGYKTHFLKKSFLGTGFREYPEGFSYRWTPDSGPILFGFGAAATGLGLNAASTVGDHETYNAVSKNLDRILGLFGSAEKVLGNTLLTRVGTNLLATSIRLNAETSSEWRLPA